VHHWVAERTRTQVSEEQAEQLDRLELHLTGALGSRRTVYRTRLGQVIQPPSWWVDDEEASASTFNAMNEIAGG